MKINIKIIKTFISVCLAAALLMTGCAAAGSSPGEAAPSQAASSGAGEGAPGDLDAAGDAGTTGAAAAGSSKELVFGVSVYDTNDAEVQLFRKYFTEYLGPAFDVRFLYSGSISSTEDELEFIEKLRKEGADGVISFYGIGLDEILSRCDEYGLWYVMGSGSISDKAFEEASAHKSFLGIIGPDTALERQAGEDMAEFFADRRGEEGGSFLILSGGAGMGNQMHLERTRGMLDELKDRYGLAYSGDTSLIAMAGQSTDVETGSDKVSITIVPGYFEDGHVSWVLEELFRDHGFDVAMGALCLNYIMPEIEKKEAEQGSDILIGMVDAFTEQNFDWFSKKDASGDTTINYVAGKYAATVGPSFAAMYNAATGEADFLKVDGRPFRLKQSFWTASDFRSYEELYDRSINIYDNIYSVKDLRSVIRLYNPEAGFEDFRALTEKEWE